MRKRTLYYMPFLGIAALFYFNLGMKASESDIGSFERMSLAVANLEESVTKKMEKRCVDASTDDCRLLQDVEVSLKELRGELSDALAMESERTPEKADQIQADIAQLKREIKSVPLAIAE